MNNPYVDLPAERFWKWGVASPNASSIPLYKKKWPIEPETRIATAGSCFAQHIGRNLRLRGFNVMDVEPKPKYLKKKDCARFGYEIYSARYGNIYTVRQLLQLAEEAFGLRSPNSVVWLGENGHFYDALRPNVEPDGFDSEEMVHAHRQYHLAKVREMLEGVELFVFTLGLTEAWVHSRDGTVYPTAPGTLAGDYDPASFSFKNFSYQEIKDDFLQFRNLVHSYQSNKCKFLLTVSPVPLTATASPQHVLVATVYSKAVLRAVAGDLYQHSHDIDYFPSFEIISNPWQEEILYEENLRSVKATGVGRVMNEFFDAHGQGESTLEDNMEDNHLDTEFDDMDIVCEEEVLAAFGRMSS